MQDYFRYVNPSKDDKHWGLFITVAGVATIEPFTKYPPSGHPSDYYFMWENGRILNEYQILFISEGGGVLEMRNNSYSIVPGTFFLVFPGVWHRYRPVLKNGWKEFFIGFDGEIIRDWCKKHFFIPDKPVYHVGNRPEYINFYDLTIDYVKSEKTGYQQLCAGNLFRMLSVLKTFKKQEQFAGKNIEKVVEQVRCIMQQNLDKQLNFEQLAAQHYTSYSYFRKMFKEYTGFAPNQYHIHLKINRAKELLLFTTDTSVKQIAYKLGFTSIPYFSRIFKEKTGVTPSEYKNQSKP